METNWKPIKDKGVFDNLPKGKMILFLTECGRYFDVLIHDHSYDTDRIEWMYVNSREIVDDVTEYAKYFIPEPEQEYNS
jgi:hypothetical protein